VRVVACADDALLYDRHLDPPLREFHIPTAEGSFMGAHSRHGLQFRVCVELVDGQPGRVPVAVTDARLLPRLEPRIDWLDLVRIAEMKRLLRTRGDTILPGMQADGVPFALEGAGGQCVLVDYQGRVPGFREYRGPQPAQVHLQIGRWGELPKARDAVTDFRGRPLVLLSYRPHWCALPETGAASRSASEASQRVYTILHETTHALWHGRTGPAAPPVEPELLLVPGIEERALEATERLVLASAVEAEDVALPGLLRDCFALREARASLGPRPAARAALAETTETSEGFAYEVAWRACQVLDAALRAGELAGDDPFYRGVQDADPLDWLPEAADEACSETGWDAGAWLSLSPSVRGATQARLLDRVRPGLLRQTWTNGGSLPQALAEAVGWGQLEAAEKAEASGQARARWRVSELAASIRARRDQVRGALLARTRESAEGQPALLRLRAEAFPPSQGQRARLSVAQYLDGLRASLGNLAVSVDWPCRVRQCMTHTRGLLDVTMGLPPELDAVLVHQGPGGLRVRGRGVRLEARHATIEVAHHMLLLRPRETRSDNVGPSTEAERERKMRGTRWMVVPVALLLGCGVGRAQLPHHEVSATIAGVFEDAGTSQQEYLELDLLDEDNWPEGDWQLVEDETYDVSATMSDEEYSRIAYVAIYDPSSQLVDDASADPPTTTLTAEGEFTATATMAWKPKFRFVHKADCTWEWEIGIEPPPEPPVPVRTIKVQVLDGGTANPLQGAMVSAWPEGHPEQTETHEVDNQGWAEFTDVAQGQWMLKATFQEHCNLQKGPYVIRKRGSLKETFRLFGHAGIRGKLTINGPGDPNDVEITLRQGGNAVQSGTVDPQQNPDGTYNYEVPMPPIAGQYTVRARHTPSETTDEEPVTVPDQCTPAHPDVDGGNITVLVTGAHTLVTGPDLTLDIPGEP
jgi:hypothetical protein